MAGPAVPARVLEAGRGLPVVALVALAVERIKAIHDDQCETCGSGLAREGGVSGDINVDCAADFASKSDRRTAAPTWIALD